MVLVHQPATAAGYLGIESLSELDDAIGSETTPVTTASPTSRQGSSVTIGPRTDLGSEQ